MKQVVLKSAEYTFFRKSFIYIYSLMLYITLKNFIYQSVLQLVKHKIDITC